MSFEVGNRLWCVFRAIAVALVLFFALANCASLRAQSIYGQIAGTVTDQKGGVVAGAKVKVTDQNTKAVRDVETNEAGDFLEGPGTGVFSAAVGKQFKLTERMGMKFEAQFANLLNHVNPDVPRTNVSSSSYGKLQDVQGGEQAGPRTVQFGLRFSF